jgi:hypothetical protein
MTLASSPPPRSGDVAARVPRLPTKKTDATASVAQVILTVTVLNLAVSVTDEEVLPDEFSLAQNYPNPFNPSTMIEYSLPRDAHVELTVFNLLGQKVRTLVDANQEAGSKSIAWDGTDAGGNDVASGVYFYAIRAGHFVAVRKLMVLR